MAKDLISELGIEVSRYPKVLDSDLYKSLGLRSAFFFDKETFGTDRLLAGDIRDEAFLAAAPVSDAVRRDHKRLLTERFDPMPGLSQSEKKARLARMSYADFLTKLWKVDPGVLPLYQTRPHGLFGVGIDAVPAQDAFGFGYPGFGAMGLDSTPGPGQNFDSIRSKEAEDYYFHFPDGNASVARLLVRSLVPAALAGSTMDDIVTARADYARLDAPGAPVRIRVSSSVMRVQHIGPEGAGRRVEVAYLPNGTRTLKTVKARSVVLACWHSTIPVPVSRVARRAEDGARVRHQGAARLHQRVRPIVEGLSEAGRPAHLDSGDVAHLGGPGFPGEPRRLQVPDRSGRAHRAAPVEGGVPSRACRRATNTAPAGPNCSRPPSKRSSEAFAINWAARSAAADSIPAADILGITVNRWPHGYAYQYNSLADDFWLNGGEQPCVVARQRFGRIAIANSDAGAYAYTDCAIDHGHRAAQELLAG